jgi:hypothetical protein
VNSIATMGSSNMSAAIIQGAILQKHPRRLPLFSAFPATALHPCIREVLILAYATGERQEQVPRLH